MLVLLQEQVKAARAQLISTKERIRQLEINLAIGTGRSGAVPDKMIASIIEQQPVIVQRVRSIEQLERDYEAGVKLAKDPNMPGLKSLKNQIEQQQMLLEVERSRQTPKIEKSLREKMADQAEFDVNAIKVNLDHYKMLEKTLEAEIKKDSRAIEEAPGAGLAFKEVEFDIEQAESEVRSVTTAINQLEVEMNDPPRVRQLQEAVGYKVDNLLRKSQLAGAAGIAMLGLCVAGIAYLEFRNRRVSTVDEVTQGLGVRVVGTVPACPRRIRSKAAGAKASYWKSMLAESVDAARTLLLHHARREDLRIIMVTSAAGGEGKARLRSPATWR